MTPEEAEQYFNLFPPATAANVVQIALASTPLSKTILDGTHSRCRRKAWVQWVSSNLFFHVVRRHSLPREERGEQKPPTCIRREVGVSNWRTLAYLSVTSEVHVSPPWHLGVSPAKLPCHISRQLLMPGSVDIKPRLDRQAGTSCCGPSARRPEI